MYQTPKEKTPHPSPPPGVPEGGDQTSAIGYIALGSNLGNRKGNIAAAVSKLSEIPGTVVLRVSDLLENLAVGGPDQSPAFLNAVAEIRTNLPAIDLLHHLFNIEKELGRVRREKWEPRVIDLDLILYGDEIIRSKELTVPHPLMHERRFVLEPLAQLCPEYVHPTIQLTVKTLLQNMPH